MRKLGRHGRFANQLFQYAYLRLFCKEYQCPPWIGQFLFGHDDPPVTANLPTVTEKRIYDIAKSRVRGRDNINIKGYFQYHTSCYPDRGAFQALFQPVPAVKEQVDLVPHMLRSGGRTLVGLHIRHGDYGTLKRKGQRWCFRAPTQWYLDWLEERWDRLPNPALLIATNDPDNVLPDFGAYKPICMMTAPDEAPYYSDFYMLTQCDYLLISNSSFGFAASMINDCEPTCYRPRLSEKKLISYDPWCSHTCLRDEQYP